MALLEIEQLVVGYRTPRGIARALDGVDLQIEEGDTLGIAGESGCGKSTLANAIMGMLPQGVLVQGQIRYRGKDLLRLTPGERRGILWNEIAMVFQGAMNALNPVRTVGQQIAEPMRVKLGLSKAEAQKRTEDLLEAVGIESGRHQQYPHEFSGGMRQRACIAMALACDPKLLIADEPTTALDMMVQAQVLDLLLGLQQSRGLTLILITHDLAVAAETSHRMALMYAGKVAEVGETRTFFSQPLHPYSRALLGSIPDINGPRSLGTGIPGGLPDLVDPPVGCRFAPRCSECLPECLTTAPQAVATAGGGMVSCHLVQSSAGLAIEREDT